MIVYRNLLIADSGKGHVEEMVGMLQDGTVWPTVVVVICFSVLSLLSYGFARWGEKRALDSPLSSGP